MCANFISVLYSCGSTLCISHWWSLITLEKGPFHAVQNVEVVGGLFLQRPQIYDSAQSCEMILALINKTKDWALVHERELLVF